MTAVARAVPTGREHAGAHPAGAADADRAAAASGRPRRRGARQYRRARADHGRVRVRAAWSPIRRSPRGSTTTSWCSCSRMSFCIWRCAPTTAPRARASSSSTTRTTTSSTTCCAPRSASRRFPPAASTCRARARNPPSRSCVEMRRNGDFDAVAHAGLGRRGDRRRPVFGRRPPAAARPGAQRLQYQRQRRRARRRARARAVSRRCRATRPRRAKAIEELAAKGLALAKAMGAMQGPRHRRRRRRSRSVDALRGIYRTPWQMALQTWLEGVAPGERTFVRPSRRGADRARRGAARPPARTPGCSTSCSTPRGSMTEEIPRALGAIADFCDAAGGRRHPAGAVRHRGHRRTRC